MLPGQAAPHSVQNVAHYNRVDFLKLRTAGENFVRTHGFNVANDAFAQTRHAFTVAFCAFFRHCRD